MTEIDLSRAEWRKSSYSSQDGNCVEVARNLPGLVAVRDSKYPDGGKLVVMQETWRAFLRAYALAPIFTKRIGPQTGCILAGSWDEVVPSGAAIALCHVRRP